MLYLTPKLYYLNQILFFLTPNMEGDTYMSRGENQKLKLLYLKQFFEDQTDEDHSATMKQILNYLKANNVDAERKSIYTDLEALSDFGMDVGKDEDG